MKKLYNMLFVCMGNTCRSPMAASYCNAEYRDKTHKIQIHADSAGLYTSGGGINPNAVSALSAAGIQEKENNRYSNHRSKNISAELIDNADLVVCMDERICAFLKNAFSESAEKIISFPSPIPDPYGGSLSEYSECLSNMIKQIDILVEEITKSYDR